MPKGQSQPKIFAVTTVTADGKVTNRLIRATRVTLVEDVLLAGTDISVADTEKVAAWMTAGVKVEEAAK